MLRPIALIISLVLLEACGFNNEDPQPHLKAFEGTHLFPDGSSARVPPAGTVSRESVSQKLDRNGLPVGLVVDRRLLWRGRTLYEANCAVCHGLDGKADGIVTKRGLKGPASFMEDHLREAPPAHFYETMSNGRGRMPSYGRRLREEERWAVAAYVKALQLSRDIEYGRLSPEDQRRLDEVSP